MRDIHSGLFWGKSRYWGNKSNYWNISIQIELIPTENEAFWLTRPSNWGKGGRWDDLWDLCWSFLFQMSPAGEGGRGPRDAAARSFRGGLDSSWRGAEQWEAKGTLGSPNHDTWETLLSGWGALLTLTFYSDPSPQKLSVLVESKRITLRDQRSDGSCDRRRWL